MGPVKSAVRLKEFATLDWQANAAIEGAISFMWLKSSIVVLTAALSAQPAAAQQAQANAQIIAQALDRCMATYAVRLTRTAASDDEIYAEATKSCAPLNAKFVDAINAEVPQPQAAELLKSIDETRKPNFFNMLAKIRSDRAKREGGLNDQQSPSAK